MISEISSIVFCGNVSAPVHTKASDLLVVTQLCWDPVTAGHNITLIDEQLQSKKHLPAHLLQTVITFKCSY